jgi:hypothetical protein
LVKIVPLEKEVLIWGKDGVELDQGVAERAIPIVGLKLPRWAARKTGDPCRRKSRLLPSETAEDVLYYRHWET